MSCFSYLLCSSEQRRGKSSFEAFDLLKLYARPSLGSVSLIPGWSNQQSPSQFAEAIFEQVYGSGFNALWLIEKFRDEYPSHSIFSNNPVIADDEAAREFILQLIRKNFNAAINEYVDVLDKPANLRFLMRSRIHPIERNFDARKSACEMINKWLDNPEEFGEIEYNDAPLTKEIVNQKLIEFAQSFVIPLFVDGLYRSEFALCYKNNLEVIEALGGPEVLGITQEQFQKAHDRYQVIRIDQKSFASELVN